MVSHVHHVEQHRSAVRGIEAFTLFTAHQFPRHSHDQLAVGVIDFGGQRSWSGAGQVRASAGDVITANPAEMHDGVPLGRKSRGWRMLYFDPSLVTREVSEEIAGEAEIVRPVVRDPILARAFTRLFESVTASQPDRLAGEETLLRCLMYLLRKHGTARSSPGGT
jgi:AraC-like ligand binding domain